MQGKAFAFGSAPAGAIVGAADGGTGLPTPQSLALTVYVKMVDEINREQDRRGAPFSEEETTKKMRAAVVAAIEGAARAQRAADAALVEVLGANNLAPAVVDYTAYLGRVLRGEEKPKEALGAAGLLLEAAL